MGKSGGIGIQYEGGEEEDGEKERKKVRKRETDPMLWSSLKMVWVFFFICFFTAIPFPNSHFALNVLNLTNAGTSYSEQICKDKKKSLKRELWTY